MANTFASDDFDSTAMIAPHNGSAVGLSGLFKSITERFALARQHRIDNEVGRFIETHGGQLTDDIERQISRRFGSMS
jgi:hypothetical protein